MPGLGKLTERAGSSPRSIGNRSDARPTEQTDTSSSTISTVGKVLVLTLAWHDGKGGIFASLDTLATESDMKRWAVAEALNALEAKAAIVRTRAQRSNRYVVVYDFHSRENPDGGNGNPTVRKNQIPPSGKPGSHRQENPDANGNNGFNGVRAVALKGERPPLPLESTRASASPPASPAHWQSGCDASGKLGETETATDEVARQAVDLTETVRPPERRSELDEMRGRYTELKDQLTDDDLDADHRLALEAMLPGMETEIARLENGE